MSISVLNFIVCLYGAYGKDCAHYCNCAEPQICDNVIGCCVRDNQTCGLNYIEGLLGKIKREVGLLNEFEHGLLLRFLAKILRDSMGNALDLAW